MFYQILRQLVATLLKVFFRKIYVIDVDHIPSDRPVILASNHPMAFCDACLLACFTKQPIHFLVRGDVFRSSWNWFFKLTNQIPIYRFRDGFSNMRKNQHSFDTVYEALARNKVVLIFAEGNTRLQKKLFPLQKGAARIAFGAWEKHKLQDLVVVPVGINYTDGTAFRSDVQISIGDGLEIRQYLDDYLKDPQAALQQFTLDLQKRLSDHVIHLQGEKEMELFNSLTQKTGLAHEEVFWPALEASRLRFDTEKKLASALNLASDQTISDISSGNMSLPEEVDQNGSLWHRIILVIIAPIALAGWLLNSIPFYLSKAVTKAKVKQIEFFSPVRLGLLLIFYCLYLFAILVLAATKIGWPSLFLAVIVPLLGYCTIIWWEYKRMLSEEKLTLADLEAFSDRISRAN